MELIVYKQFWSFAALGLISWKTWIDIACQLPWKVELHENLGVWQTNCLERLFIPSKTYSIALTMPVIIDSVLSSDLVTTSSNDGLREHEELLGLMKCHSSDLDFEVASSSDQHLMARSFRQNPADSNPSKEAIEICNPKIRENLWKKIYERSRLSSCLYPSSCKRLWPESIGSPTWIVLLFVTTKEC
nr:hypothetical protein Iba_chr12fCG8290 [Ipomoea batatas]